MQNEEEMDDNEDKRALTRERHLNFQLGERAISPARKYKGRKSWIRQLLASAYKNLPR